MVVLFFCLLYAATREYLATRIKKTGKHLGLRQKSFAMTLGLFTIGFLGIMTGETGFVFLVTPASISLILSLIVIVMVRQMSSMRALAFAERSSTMIFEIGMLPLIILLQILVGQTIGMREVIGIILIEIVVIGVFFGHIASITGIKYLFISGICMASYSLISFMLLDMFTTPYSLQFLQGTFQLLILSSIMHKNRQHIAPVFHNRQLLQLSAINGVVLYFYFSALSIGNPGMVSATTLTLGLIAALITGRKYFGETHIVHKFASAMLIVLGVILMYIPG